MKLILVILSALLYVGCASNSTTDTAATEPAKADCCGGADMTHDHGATHDHAKAHDHAGHDHKHDHKAGTHTKECCKGKDGKMGTADCCKKMKNGKNKDCCAGADAPKGDRHGASEGAKCAKGSEATCMADTWALSSPKLMAQINQEDFTKAYNANKDALGKSCSTAATTYCGKTTAAGTISEGDLNCLWTKVFRVTRESLPKLDNTDCANMIKKIAKK